MFRATFVKSKWPPLFDGNCRIKTTGPIWGGFYIHFTYIQKVQPLWDNMEYIMQIPVFFHATLAPTHVFQLVVLPNNSYVVSAPSIRLVELLNWIISPKNWSKNHTKSLKPPPIVLGISSKKSLVLFESSSNKKQHISHWLIDSYNIQIQHILSSFLSAAPVVKWQSHLAVASIPMMFFFPLVKWNHFSGVIILLMVQKSQTTTWDGAKTL